MKKAKILQFLKDLLYYAIVLFVLLFIAKESRWPDVTVRGSAIGLTFAWVVWKLVTLWRDRKKK